MKQTSHNTKWLQKGIKAYGFWLIGAMVFLSWLPSIISGIDKLEATSFELRQKWITVNRHESGVALVNMDDNLNKPEVKAAFGRFPFHRDLYGYLADSLSRSGAKAIMYDISFSGGEDECHPEGDAYFAHASKQAVSRGSMIYSVLGLNDTPFFDAGFSDRQMGQILSALPPSVYKAKLPEDFPAMVQDGLEAPIDALLQDSKMIFSPAGAAHYDANKKVSRAGLFNVLQIEPSANAKGNRQVHDGNKAGTYHSNEYIKMLNFPTMAFLAVAKTADRIQWSSRHQLKLNNHLLDLKGEDKPIIHWYGNAMTESQLIDTKTARRQSNYNLDLGDFISFQKLAKGQTVYPKYSFWDVVKAEIALQCKENRNLPICKKVDWQSGKNNPIPANAFQDKYVLIGMTAGAFTQDNHSTLYSAQYPGVYIQANVLDNILHNDFVARSGWRITPPQWLYPDTISLVDVLTCILLGFLTYWACSRWHKMSVALMFCVALMLGYTLATIGMYVFQNVWVNWTYPTLTMILSTFISYLVRYKSTEAEKSKLRFAFGKYVSPTVMERIESDPKALHLGGERREITALFCDIRGFTTFSESHSPEEVQKLLTEYFSMMNRIILNEYGGTINKLIGDAIMAYWGFPVSSEEDALKAVQTALAMQAALENWRAQNPTGPDLRIGIGINTGPVMIGNVGSEDFMDFTIIGDAVNLASRLESATKKMGVPILISQNTFDKVKDLIDATDLGDIDVAGKEEKIRVFHPTQIKGK
jgi:class 3 adenylate cyclase/CHASE2 domain-containing sensor protein